MATCRNPEEASALQALNAGAKGTLLSGERRIRCEGVEIHHHSGVSAFGEHAVVSRRSVVKITKDVDLVEAALFGCAVMTGVGTVINTCRVKLGESVAVIGLGGVGLSAILGAAAAGILVIYAGGLAQLAVLTGSLGQAAVLGVLPFAALDAVKAVVAALLAPRRAATAER